MIKRKHKTNWKWKPKRWWISLILFWFIGTAGSGIITRSSSSRVEGGFIVALMLFFAIFAAVTDREWNIPIRIIWVIGIYFIHALLTIPMIFTIGLLAYLGGRPHLVDRLVSLSAAFPLVIWAMHRSRFFVEPVNEQDKRSANLD